MTNPAIRKDSYLGDFLNALLLRDPYREPAVVHAIQTDPLEPPYKKLGYGPLIAAVRTAFITTPATGLLTTAIKSEDGRAELLAVMEDDERAFVKAYQDIPDGHEVDAQTLRAAALAFRRAFWRLEAQAGVVDGKDDVLVDTDPQSGGEYWESDHSSFLPDVAPDLSFPEDSGTARIVSPTGVEVTESNTGNYRQFRIHVASDRILIQTKPTSRPFESKVVLDPMEAQIARLVIAGNSNRRVAKQIKHSLGYTLKRFMVLKLKFDATSRQDLKTKLIHQHWTTSDEINATLVKIGHGSAHKGKFIVKAAPSARSFAFQKAAARSRDQVKYAIVDFAAFDEPTQAEKEAQRQSRKP